MADETVSIVIKAEDKASGVFKNVESGLGGLGGALKGLVPYVAIGAAVGAAGGFMIDSFKAAAAAEKEMIVATTAVNNTLQTLSEEQLAKLHEGMAAGLEDFEVMEKKMADVGEAAIKLGFDDEAASVAFAKLFQVTGDVTQAQSDLALAMDLAAFSGRDLESTARAVTMVHAGGTRVLKEFGIEVAEGTTALDALAMVQEKVGGTAEQMAKTTSGQLQVLSLQWGNLKESVGAALAEAITPFISQLTEWASKPETQEKIKEIVEAIAQFVKIVIQVLKVVLPPLIEILKVLWSVLSALLDMWGKVWQAIGTATIKVEQFIDRVKSMVEWVSNAIQKIKELATAMGSGIISGVANTFNNVVGGTKKMLGFAEGGVVPGALGAPVPAIVHGGETIIPAGQSGGITIFITGNTILNEDMVQYIGDSLMNRLKLNLRI